MTNNINNQEFFEISAKDNIKKNLSNNRKWLKYNSFSRRHDSFFFIYSFAIYEDVKDIKNIDVINGYNMISKALLKMNSEELNNGIWRILNIYKNSKFDLSKKGFKKFYTIIQHIENFRNLEMFCINYTLIEGGEFHLAISHFATTI